MDNRLRFLYHLVPLTTGGRRRVENRATGCARPSSEAEETGKSVSSLRPGCDGEGNFSTEVLDLTLPRKASKEEQGARTANRHR
jgi:hypothetical protein